MGKRILLAVTVLFVVNIIMMLCFYHMYLNPAIDREVAHIGFAVKETVERGALSSDEVVDVVGDAIAQYRGDVSRGVIVKLIVYEAGILFVLLIVVGAVTYHHLVRPINELIRCMNDYANGILPTYPKLHHDELCELQSQFISLIHAVEAEKQKQSRIIASISHDIKTPMTAVMGYTERLLKVDCPPDRQRKYLSIIYAKSQSINELINEFDEYLSYNFDSALVIKRHTVSAVCAYIQSEYADELSDAGAAFVVVNHCGDTPLRLDLVKFKRVIGNLIGNSLKFTEDSPVLTLEVSGCGDKVQFTFSDNGCGVAEHELPNIFDPLYTSDTSRKVAGLGLSICKNIIAAHGGCIHAFNNAQGGLDVEMTLPL